MTVVVMPLLRKSEGIDKKEEKTSRESDASARVISR
jgi:hypothetical protein